MADTTLTRQQILDTTEDVLRRYGPAKATVADVARALGVSPGSIYRHFPTKVALREAVIHEWLHRVHAGLDEIATSPTPAPERLRHWLTRLFEAKKQHSRDDPELFDTFTTLVAEHGDAAVEHTRDLVDQLQTIIAAGVERGEFAETDSAPAAIAVFTATTTFHNPLFRWEWSEPGIDAVFQAVTNLIVEGLTRR
ncbi:TetR family transcriptional regulator [Saccharopolyspora sp. K220]|uniref:TetR family transcriptional regulator n=1 Tax=Saccharopolyspora soli TaxID=2926618 RepID=UPI001F57CDB1|nr:TetR family transcriptional regulator [Saccharopolyspora soli]MCI2419269.1 TetR family transcriptional regulator [Saccharopolyspora soli]